MSAYSEGKEADYLIKSARYSLHYALQMILKLLAPITPFVTEEVYQSVYEPKKSIHQEIIPKSSSMNGEEDSKTADIINLNSFIDCMYLIQDNP